MKHPQRLFQGVMLLFVIGAACGLYYFWGAYQDFVHVKAFQSISKELADIVNDSSLSRQEVLVRLERLKQRVSDSHKGLARLAEVYLEIGQRREALAVLEKAMLLSPENKEYVLQWVYLEAFLNDGKLPALARHRAENLQRDPQYSGAAKNILAMDDYFRGRYGEAIMQWEEVLRTDPTLLPERRKTIEKAIANARAKMLGLPPKVQKSQEVHKGGE